MDDKKQEVLSKVAKLLQLAADQDGKPEGETAMAMASKLMAKHHIAESEIDFGNNGHSDVFEDDEGIEILLDKGGKRQWVADIASMLAYTFDCKSFFRTYYGTVHFIGTEKDIETCCYFMEVVFHHINSGARKMWPKEINWRKRNIFGTAAARVVVSRLHKMKELMNEESTKHYSGGTDLMVIKKDIVEQEWNKIQDEFTKSKRKDVKLDDKKTTLAGMKNGESAPLNLAID